MAKRHKAIETTDIMLQMVASGRGVAALPRWLVDEYAATMDIAAVKLGKAGIDKQIFIGMREAELATGYLHAFLELARRTDGAANSKTLAGRPVDRVQASKTSPAKKGKT